MPPSLVLTPRERARLAASDRNREKRQSMEAAWEILCENLRGIEDCKIAEKRNRERLGSQHKIQLRKMYKKEAK